MIIVRIVGGLGNQMFQYATARAVAIGRPLPLGKGVRLGVGAHAPHSSIGDHFYLAGGASLFDTSIGKYCSIGDAAMIGLARRPTHGHVSTYPGFFSSSNSSASARYYAGDALFDETLTTVVGLDVWIGA